MLVLVGLLVVGLVAGVVLIAKMDQLTHRLSAVQLDNPTWRISQLRTEHQDFRIALYEAHASIEVAGGVVPEAVWHTVVDKFDIYYSRLDDFRFLAPYLNGISRADGRFDTLEDDLEINRAAMADIIDSTERPDAATIAALSEIVRTDRLEVDLLVMEALGAINARAYDDRLAHLRLTNLVWVFGGIIVALFPLTLLLAGRVSARLYGTASLLDRAWSRVETIITAAPVAIIACEPGGNILEANAAAEELAGLPRDAMAHCHDLVSLVPARLRRKYEKDGAPLDFSRLFRDLAGTTWRLPIRKATGKIVQISVTAVMEDRDEGRIAIMFAQDVSDREKENRRVRRARNAAMQFAQTRDRFLSEMSHEMRTPLHGVIAALDLVRNAELPPDAARLITVARSSASTALAQIDDVLEAVRPREAGEVDRPTDFSPYRAARTVIEEMSVLATSRQNRILLESEITAPQRGDGNIRAFQRALTNIVGNACKFTEGGRIVVRMFTATPGFLRVEVEDEGIGIAPEVLPHIFKDYVTADSEGWDGRGGYGLGLSIFVAAVETMKGTYGVQSTPGKGTMFWFEFPFVAKEAGAAFAAAPAAAAAVGLAVLCVDDNPVNLELLEQMIRTLGHHPVTAGDGRTAVALAARTRFDLVLTDIRMPGLDGFETAAAIRAGGASARAVIVGATANLINSPDMRRNADQAGMDRLLVKPLTTADISRLIATLDNKTGDAEAAEVVAVPEGIIDLETARFARSAQGAARFDQVCAETMEKAETLAQRLESGAEAGADLADGLHHLIGACLALGLRTLGQALAAGEVAVRQDRADDRAESGESILDCIADSRAALQAAFARGESSAA